LIDSRPVRCATADSSKLGLSVVSKIELIAIVTQWNAAWYVALIAQCRTLQRQREGQWQLHQRWWRIVMKVGYYTTRCRATSQTPAPRYGSTAVIPFHQSHACF